MPYYHIFGIQFKKKNEKINLFESNKPRLIKLRSIKKYPKLVL